MEVRRVQPGEGVQLRELRLKALADAPYAFSSSLAEAEKVPLEAWEERAMRHAAGERDVMFVAVEDQRWCGMAGGFFPQGQPGPAELFSMWVAPAKRRSGLALSLTQSVAQWARERGAGEIQLWVARENEAARALYQRAGFVDTGSVKRLASNEATEVIMMRQDLQPAHPNTNGSPT